MTLLNIPPLVADKISPHAKELLKKVRSITQSRELHDDGHSVADSSRSRLSSRKNVPTIIVFPALFIHVANLTHR
jgi:hypothetical protein